MKEDAALIEKMRALKTASEYQSFVKEYGKELTLEQAEKEFAAIQSRLSPLGKDVDDNELACVNAGFGLPECPDTAYGECLATVEAGSWCVGVDACCLIVILYGIEDYVS